MKTDDHSNDSIERDMWNGEWIDPQLKPFLLKTVERMKQLKDPRTRPLSEVRKGFEESLAFWNSNGPTVKFVSDDIIPGPFGNVKVRIYSDAPDTKDKPCLVYFHGGGWVAGSVESYDYFSRYLSKSGSVCVVSVDYGLSPEQHFPDTLYECVSVLRWVRKNSQIWAIDKERIAVGGDSAGGNLAIASALALRDLKENWLKYCLLIYPALNPDLNTESHRKYGGVEYGNPMDWFNWFWDCYVPDKKEHINPLAVPILAEFKGLPPMYILGAGLDPMGDDLIILSSLLKSAGVPFTLKFVPGVIHGFMHMIKAVDSAARAADDIAITLKSRLHSKTKSEIRGKKQCINELHLSGFRNKKQIVM